MSAEPLLEIANITVRYGKFVALRDVSYRIHAGSIVCLLGGNASGKSSTMKAIFGLVRLAAGHIYWKGEDISLLNTSGRVPLGIAAVPEGRRIFPRLTVAENLEMGAIGSGLSRPTTSLVLEEIYTRFPRLAERRAQLGGTLSGGEQQMLAIGRALLASPEIICMDEPSMGLAPRLVKENFELISELREQGLTIFLVEQNARAALAIADYAYVLDSGRLVLEGEPKDIASSERMRVAYLGTTDSSR